MLVVRNAQNAQGAHLLVQLSIDAPVPTRIHTKKRVKLRKDIEKSKYFGENL